MLGKCDSIKSYLEDEFVREVITLKEEGEHIYD